MFSYTLNLVSENRSQAVPDGAVSMLAGNNAVSIQLSQPQAVEQPEYLKTVFSFELSPLYRGSRGSIIFYNNSRKLSEKDIIRYGETRVGFILAGYKFGDRLNVQVRISEFGDHLPLNSEVSTIEVGSLSLESAHAVPENLSSRLALTKAAVTAAEVLGLKGVYMKGEKKDSFLREVHSRLDQGRSLSAIRLGDGEGRVLGFPGFFSQQEIINQVLYYHFGPRSINEILHSHPTDWVEALSSELRKLLTTALSGADYVGLPVVEYFSNLDEEPTIGKVAYASAMTIALQQRPDLTTASVVGTNVFQQLAQDPTFFPSISQVAKKVHIVGPWDLTASLATALGVDKIGYVEVARHYTWAEEKGLGQFPFLYKNVVRTLENMGDLRGQLFLVGAGIIGKYYCNVIKHSGGVALDIGSVFDAWAKRGRPEAVASADRINMQVFNDEKRH